MKNRWFGLIVVVLMLVASAVLYAYLPERVPTHWNARGEVDGWSSRGVAAFLMPLLGLGMWALLNVLPKIDPKRANYERFDETYWLVVGLIILFLGVIHGAMLANALGVPIGMERITPLGVGLLFVVLGNYLPRVKPNWWMGIRTPWTLESPHVWQRTHRVGGWCFVAAGVLLMISTLLPAHLLIWAVVLVTAVASLVPTVYSYLLWRREARGAES